MGSGTLQEDEGKEPVIQNSTQPCIHKHIYIHTRTHTHTHRERHAQTQRNQTSARSPFGDDNRYDPNFKSKIFVSE